MDAAQLKQVRTPHGAKAAEVYGIVGYLLSLVTFGMHPAFSCGHCGACGAAQCFLFRSLLFPASTSTESPFTP